MRFDFSEALCLRLRPRKKSRELNMIAKGWGMQALGLVMKLLGRQYAADTKWD